jgi:hypothetical protein
VAQHPAPAARRTDSYTLHEPSQFGASPPGQKPAQPLLPIGQAEALRQVAAALEMAGLTRGGSVAKAAPAPLTGEMARLARTLNTESRRSKAYQDAIKAWPDSTPIWPHLENREARVNLVNHVVDTDKTNENAYGTFLNRCIGFATQLYARFSASAPAGKAELKDLETRLRYTPQDLADPKKRAEIDKPGNIQADQTPAKLRLPMFVAQNDTHAINAFLVDESRPNDVRSYMFYDPQNDGLLHAQHPDYKRHVQTWGIDICDARLNAAGQFDLTRKVTLLPTASGEMVPYTSAAKKSPVVSLVRDFAVAAKTDATRVASPQFADFELKEALKKGGGTFDGYIRKQVQQWKATDTDLLAAARFIVGRSFRTSLTGPPETVTAERYLQILGRPDLKGKF